MCQRMSAIQAMSNQDRKNLSYPSPDFNQGKVKVHLVERRESLQARENIFWSIF